MRLNNKISLMVPGKINLFHKIGKKDIYKTYHSVFSLYLAVSIYEKIEIKCCYLKNQKYYSISEINIDYIALLKLVSINLKYSERIIPLIKIDTIPIKENNLAYKAVKIFLIYLSKYFIHKHPFVLIRKYSCIHITIYKNIPIASGMGGGSSDAAAVLMACNQIWDNPFSQIMLSKLAKLIGSDVNFFLYSGISIMGGQGNRFYPLLNKKENNIYCLSKINEIKIYLVIIFSNIGLKTKFIYNIFEKKFSNIVTCAKDQFLMFEKFKNYIIQFSINKNIHNFSKIFSNDLEKAVLYTKSNLLNTINDGMNSGALKAIISGSGPTVALLALNKIHAIKIYNNMKSKKYKHLQIVYGPVLNKFNI